VLRVCDEVLLIPTKFGGPFRSVETYYKGCGHKGFQDAAFPGIVQVANNSITVRPKEEFPQGLYCAGEEGTDFFPSPPKKKKEKRL